MNFMFFVLRVPAFSSLLMFSWVNILSTWNDERNKDSKRSKALLIKCVEIVLCCVGLHEAKYYMHLTFVSFFLIFHHQFSFAPTLLPHMQIERETHKTANWLWHVSLYLTPLPNASATSLIATQIRPFKSIMHSNAETFTFLFASAVIVAGFSSFPVCLTAEVLPQRAAHRAGEEGRVRCALLKREFPFLTWTV